MSARNPRLLSRGRRAWAISAAIGLGAALLVLVVQWSGWLRIYELRSVDLLMRLRGAAPADPRVVVCDIDADGVDYYGQWPWPRPILAELVDRLAAGGARVIAFDIVFSEPSRAGPQDDEQLAAALRKAGNVVLGYYFRREHRPSGPTRPRHGGDPANLLDSAIEQVIEPGGGFPMTPRGDPEPNIDPLAAAADSQGFFSIDPDPDGVLRHYAVVAAHDGTYYPALAVRAVQRALSGGPLALSPHLGRLPRLTLADRPVPTDEQGLLWINYRGPAGAFTTIPALDVLQGRADPALLRDKIVFIGASETGIADLRATPLASVVPGVEVHATVADNLLNNRFIHDTAAQLSVSLAAVLTLGPIVGLLVPAFPRSSIGMGLAASVVLGWLAACWIAFARFDAHLQIIYPFLAAGLAYVGAATYEAVFVEAKARQIKKTFKQFVSPAVVEEMLRDPERVKLGGERREMTVLFADIRGFTSISERMEPEQVTRLLNEFLTPMTRVAIEAGGTLDKYMGDALMVFFGAPMVQPDHAARACRAAVAMGAELARLNAAWAGQRTLPEGVGQILIGIGLNSGMMSVGNMGSEAVFDYTVVGDSVNLGSRLEGLNKIYGTQVIASEFTVAAAGGGWIFRELDRVRVKGKADPVAIHELAGPAPAPGEIAGRLERFRMGLAAYRSRDFQAAEGAFSELVADGREDGPARLYLERCRKWRLNPPPETWDAVETLTTK